MKLLLIGVLALGAATNFVAAAAADDAIDLQTIAAQSKENAAVHAGWAEASIKRLTAELVAAKKGRLNSKLTEPKARGNGSFVYRSKAEKDADCAALAAKLAEERARLRRIKDGSELCLPILNEFAKPGQFYVLNYGVLNEVRSPTSCYWDIGSGGTSGGFGVPSSTPTMREGATICLLRGLKDLDREKPATLKLYGQIFKYAGASASGGRRIYLFDHVDRAAAEAALKVGH